MAKSLIYLSICIYAPSSFIWPRFISLIVIDIFILYYFVNNNVGSKTMSNFSCSIYYACLMIGQSGYRGCTAYRADTKHARNVNNGKLKKKRIFRFCGSKFRYFWLFHLKSKILDIMRYCLTWSEEKQGPKGTRNRRKEWFQHKNKHKRS